ncbi:MAG: PDZ domain-containing protein [Thermoguttaceae bacterium]
MRTAHVVLLLLVLSASADANDKISDCVVKVYSTLREPNFVRPWTKDSPREASGSGVILAGKRILTNAHVVAYASQVFVQANQSTERVLAKVKVFVPRLDMAILEVDNPTFFEQRSPLPLADNLPAMKQSVSVYGYPVGGEQLSITQGVVSRIEYRSIAYGSSAVRIQIDAALNPGNSGGPAVSDGKLIGLVFSKYSTGENIGYLLAAEEVKMLLMAIEKGRYAGKLQLGEEVATTENEALRAKLGLEKEAGVLVVQPFSDKPDYPLKRWDVILKIGDQPLDSQGNVKVLDDLRLSYQYLVPKLAHDSHVKLTVFRNRKTVEVNAPVRAQVDLVIPHLLGKYPRYFIYGPMVFTQATQDFAARIAASAMGATYTTFYKSPLVPRLLDQPCFAGEEIVTLTHLLPHKTSKGYSPPSFSAVSRINGAKVRNLAHLVELLRDATGEFLVVELTGPIEPLVFRRAEVLQATEEILADEGIRKQYSDDLENVWRKPK